MPEYIDIHAHVNFEAYKEDREETIKRALDAKTWMINVGTQKDTSLSAVQLAHKYEKGVYAIIGLHPVHTSASYHDENELGEGGKNSRRGASFLILNSTKRSPVIQKLSLSENVGWIISDSTNPQSKNKKKLLFNVLNWQMRLANLSCYISEVIKRGQLTLKLCKF